MKKLMLVATLMTSLFNPAMAGDLLDSQLKKLQTQREVLNEQYAILAHTLIIYEAGKEGWPIGICSYPNAGASGQVTLTKYEAKKFAAVILRRRLEVLADKAGLKWRQGQ